MNGKEGNGRTSEEIVRQIRKLARKVGEELRKDPGAALNREKLQHGFWWLGGILERVFFGPVGPELITGSNHLDMFQKGGKRADSLSSNEEILLAFKEEKLRSRCVALLFPEGSGVGFAHPRFPKTFNLIREGNSCLVAGLQSSEPVLESKYYPGQGCQFTPLVRRKDSESSDPVISMNSTGSGTFSKTHGGLLIELGTDKFKGYGMLGEPSLLTYDEAFARARSQPFMLMVEGIHLQTGRLNEPFDDTRYDADTSQFNGIGYFEYKNSEGKVIKRIVTLTFYNPKVAALIQDFGSDSLVARKIGVKGGGYSGYEIHVALNIIANELSHLGNTEISWTFVATEYNHGGTTFITGDTKEKDKNGVEVVTKEGNKRRILEELETGYHQGLLVISKNGPPHHSHSPADIYIHDG